jgi:hypothetical protein
MNTLQKLADIETKVGNIETKLKLFESLAVGQPKLAQEVGNIKMDLNTINKAVKNIADAVSVRTKNLNDMDNMIITRLMGMEQAYASLSKTIACVLGELADSNVLNQKNVMKRIQKHDEQADREQVEGMLKLKVIEPGEKIENDSLIVVSQTFFPKEEGKEPYIVAEYRSLNLANPEVGTDQKENYIGKAANDVVDLNLPDGMLKTTVLQIYNYVKVYAKGEGEDTPADQPATETPTQPTTN